MDEETSARAMDPFFTTKGIGEGTGLGLSMVRTMVEQCGGQFSLEIELGEGTTAYILLKLAKEGLSDMTDESAPETEPARSLRILAVDDDAIILFNTVTILEDMGHEVAEASSGTAALETLENERFDLMMTDYAMPGMTGAELAEKAIERDPDLKIILASGYADLPDGKTLELRRLSKPYSEDELARAIAEVCTDRSSARDPHR